MCIWQGGNLGILLRGSEDWKTMCWYKTNNYVFKGVRQGMNEYSSRLANLKQVGMLWFHVDMSRSTWGHMFMKFNILYMFEPFVSPKKCIFVLSFWCKRVVAIKPNQAPNRRQFEEFEVKTSTVETMLSSRLMPGEKIGKRMGWVVIGEFESGGDAEVIAQQKWTVFGVGRTYVTSKVSFLGSCAIELTTSSDPG